jgi:hypothetical protein
MFTRARRGSPQPRTMITMNLNIPVSGHSVGPAGVPSFDLEGRLSRLYDLAQSSTYLFGSPLALDSQRREPFLPRFVYFGPQTSEASPRLAVFAGSGRHDLPAARAVTAFVEKLALNPDIGHALNVSFFPVVNVLGLLAGAEERELSDENWAGSAEPELQLLSEDVRLRGYQGFIRVVTSDDLEPSAWLRTVISPLVARSPVEVFTSADFEPWPVRFEALPGELVNRGPLSFAADLPYAPFEVELRLPADWSQARTDASLSALLKRLITRYRSFLAYGQNL